MLTKVAHGHTCSLVAIKSPVVEAISLAHSWSAAIRSLVGSLLAHTAEL